MTAEILNAIFTGMIAGGVAVVVMSFVGRGK